MNTWTYLRIGLISAGFFSAWLTPLGPQADPTIGWGSLLAIFVFCPVGILFTMGIQVLNPKSNGVWQRPSWQMNPFALREPLQFFHFGACASIASGIGFLIRLALSPMTFYPEALVPIVMGTGILLGIQMATIVYSTKISSGT